MNLRCRDTACQAEIPYREQALLCSGNGRLIDFAVGLERMGIPVLFLGSLFERPEIKDLIAIASILVDRRAMGLVRLAATTHLPMPLADVSAVVDFAKSLDLSFQEWMARTGEIENLTSQGRDGLQLLARLLDGFEPNVTPWRLLAEVMFDRTRMAAQIASGSSVESRSKGIAIWQFMNFLRLQPKGPGLPIWRLMERVRRLVLLADERELRQLIIDLMVENPGLDLGELAYPVV